jgi:hypothetical protein
VENVAWDDPLEHWVLEKAKRSRDDACFDHWSHYESKLAWPLAIMVWRMAVVETKTFGCRVGQLSKRQVG